MTDNERFDHVILKAHEILFLWQRHYKPLGKTPPESYFEFFRVIIYAAIRGELPALIDEPIEEEEVRQLDMFARHQHDMLAEKNDNSLKGTLFEEETSETKT